MRKKRVILQKRNLKYMHSNIPDYLKSSDVNFRSFYTGFGGFSRIISFIKRIDDIIFFRVKK